MKANYSKKSQLKLLGTLKPKKQFIKGKTKSKSKSKALAKSKFKSKALAKPKSKSISNLFTNSRSPYKRHAVDQHIYDAVMSSKSSSKSPIYEALSSRSPIYEEIHADVNRPDHIYTNWPVTMPFKYGEVTFPKRKSFFKKVVDFFKWK
jgi:hypothetical protein